jgi:hypothetical protein
MTTSNVVERKRLPSRAEDSHTLSERQTTLADSESSQTESSTTLVHLSSTLSEESFPDSQENRLETFQSFKEWLSSFAPTGEGGSEPENEKNLAALREAHPALRHKLATSNFHTDAVADTLADSTRHGLPIRVSLMRLTLLHSTSRYLTLQTRPTNQNRFVLWPQTCVNLIVWWL